MSTVLEISWSWKQQLLAVEHVPRVEALTLCVGVGAATPPRVERTQEGAQLRLPPGTRVTGDATAHVLDDAAWTVHAGETLELNWHGLHARVCWVDAQHVEASGGNVVDALWLQVTAGVGGVVALLATMMVVGPRELPDARVDTTLATARRLVSLVPPPPPRKRAPSGGARPKPVGTVGRKDATVARAARPKGNSTSLVARREADLKKVQGAGLLAWLTGKDRGIKAVMSNDLGGEITRSLGNLQAGPQAAALGNEGWASHGSGPGGGGGVLGLGTLGDGGRRGPGGVGDIPLREKKPALVTGQCVSCRLVGDGLSRDVIARVMRNVLSQVRYCFEKELNGNPNLAGKVSMTFVIGADGKVSNVDVADSSLQHEPTEQCVSRVIQRLRFPEPRGGGTVTVNYPFVFQSAGG